MHAAVSPLHTLSLFFAMVFLCGAATVDARIQKIPNILTLLILLLFPVFAATAPVPMDWLAHLGIFAVLLAGGLWIYNKKWMGAGDLKLLAVLGLWAGPRLTPLLLIITTLAGGLLCLCVAGLAALRRWQKKDADQTPLLKLPVSYGVAIATGGLCVLLMLSHNSVLPN